MSSFKRTQVNPKNMELRLKKKKLLELEEAYKKEAVEWEKVSAENKLRDNLVPISMTHTPTPLAQEAVTLSLRVQAQLKDRPEKRLREALLTRDTTRAMHTRLAKCVQVKNKGIGDFHTVLQDQFHADAPKAVLDDDHFMVASNV